MGDSSATVPQRSTDDTIIGLIDAAKEDGAGYYDVALPHLPFSTTARRTYAIGSLPKGRFEQRASTRCGKWPLQVDFDSAARVYGEQVLRERCGSDVSAATIDALVAAVIDILGKVVRSQAN